MKKVMVFIVLVITIEFLTMSSVLSNNIPNISINEFMASNGDTIISDNNENTDWIEIMNNEDRPVDIGGLYISDHKDKPLKWQIPKGYSNITTIMPKGKIILWADEETDIGPLHVDFKLSKEGETITITSEDRETVIDKIEFATQMRDVSFGRNIDNNDKWMYFLEATPGKDNVAKGFSNVKTIDYYLFFKKYTTLIWTMIIVSALIISILLLLLFKQRKYKKQNLYNNYYDKVTGLFNRTFFEEKINWIDTERNLPVSIIIGDINGLKLINDAFGHDEGDILLKQVAQVVRKSCSRKDVIIRWGGDEFIVLLPNASQKYAYEVCNRIRNNCLLHKHTDRYFPVSIALGYATKEIITESIQDVIKKAEDIMYNNKLQESKTAHKNIISYLLKKLGSDNSKKEIQKIALKIGCELHLPQKHLDDLRLLSLYYNIGKVALMGDTLDDKDKIKRHPIIGYSILKTNPEYAHVAEEVLSHHECWDGSGYPQGLRGDEIPLNSRIMSVIDEYESMINIISHTQEDNRLAIEEIKKEAGSKFDPNILPTIVKVLENTI